MLEKLPRPKRDFKLTVGRRRQASDDSSPRTVHTNNDDCN